MPSIASRGRGRRTMNEINMVPFIDVMLVLLIIFMVTAPLITPSQISLPSVGQADRTPERFVQVLIDKDGKLEVKDGTASANPQSANLNTLVQQVRTLQGNPLADGKAVPVIISADKNVKYENVVEAMNRLRSNGIDRVGLSVQTSR